MTHTLTPRTIPGRSAPDPAPPSEWNVLATARNHQQRHLARPLKRFGDFWWSRYPGLLLGRVEDHEAFFTQLMQGDASEPGFLAPVARVIPITQTFAFTPETLLAQLREAVHTWAAQIDSRTFHVRCERRGHSGLLHGHDLERALDESLRDDLEARGHQPRLDFKDPEIVIAVELVDRVCGLGLITKALRTQFPFVRIS